MDKFKCMLAKPLNEKKLSFPCYVSPKLDGIRAQFYKGEFYTRNKKKLIGLTHLKKAMAFLNASETWLDGELLIPGLTFQQSSGKIRNYSEEPDVCFHVFDAPYEGGPQRTRIQTAEDAVELVNHDQVLFVPHIIVQSAEKMHSLYKEYRGAGLEGAMVKCPNGLYHGRRSDAWMKMKAVETYDVECVGFFEGMGRLTGTLGGIIVELDGVRVRVGGGFSDADRDHIWRCRDKYRGTVCEIAGQELTPDGSLRHPRFITWRPDK